VYNYAPNDVYLRVKYEGDWRDGKKSGKGKLSWFVGDFYEGDWLEGKRHGFGVFSWADGARFEGEWEGGMRHGKGLYIWPDGETFEGRSMAGVPWWFLSRHSHLIHCKLNLQECGEVTRSMALGY